MNTVEWSSSRFEETTIMLSFFKRIAGVTEYFQDTLLSLFPNTCFAGVAYTTEKIWCSCPRRVLNRFPYAVYFVMDETSNRITVVGLFAARAIPGSQFMRFPRVQQRSVPGLASIG